MEQEVAYPRVVCFPGEADPNVHIPYHERYKRISIAFLKGFVKREGGKAAQQESSPQSRFAADLLLPGEAGFAEMTIVGRLTVYRAEQLEPLNDCSGPEIERFDELDRGS